MSDNFFHVQKVATEADTKANWLGGKNGKYFRCCLCGQKLAVGDQYRVIYTNDMPKAGGNPLVCNYCDGSNEAVRRAWAQRCEDFRAMRRSPKFWWFFRGEND